MVWDEALQVRRERVLQKWFADVFHPRGGGISRSAFSREALERSWPFSREEPDGHPPFYALIGLAGWWLTHDVLHPLTAYRFGPMVLYAATVGVLFHHVTRRRGWLAGSTTAALLLLMPRLFVLGHYAHYDMPMTCLWLLAQVAFINSLRSPGWAVPFGIALGLAAGSKFTGCFAVVAPMAWVVWGGRSHRAATAPARERGGTAHAFRRSEGPGMGPADRGDDDRGDPAPVVVRPDSRCREVPPIEPDEKSDDPDPDVLPRPSL